MTAAERTMRTWARGLAGALVMALALPSVAHAQDEVIVEPSRPAPVAPPAPVAGPVAPGPRVITDYEEGDPVPAGYRPATRTRKGLVIGGAVTFGSLYLISVLIAAANDDIAKADNTTSSTDALYIPAIGPFVQMANSGSATAKVFLAIDGIAQSAGVAMFVLGITSPKTVLVRDALGKGTMVGVAPAVSRGASGMSVVGTF